MLYGRSKAEVTPQGDGIGEYISECGEQSAGPLCERLRGKYDYVNRTNEEEDAEDDSPSKGISSHAPLEVIPIPLGSGDEHEGICSLWGRMVNKISDFIPTTHNGLTWTWKEKKMAGWRKRRTVCPNYVLIKS